MMNPEQTVAVAEFAGSKAVKTAKGEIAQESKSEVNFVVNFETGETYRVEATVAKSADETRPVTASLPQKAMLMHLLAKMPVQVREKFMRDFVAGNVPNVKPEVVDEVEESWNKVAETTTKTVTGKVRVRAKVASI